MKVFQVSEDMEEHIENGLKDTSKWPPGEKNRLYISLVFFDHQSNSKNICAKHHERNIKHITTNREAYLKIAPNDPKMPAAKGKIP